MESLSTEDSSFNGLTCFDERRTQLSYQHVHKPVNRSSSRIYMHCACLHGLFDSCNPKITSRGDEAGQQSPKLSPRSAASLHEGRCEAMSPRRALRGSDKIANLQRLEMLGVFGRERTRFQVQVCVYACGYLPANGPAYKSALVARFDASKMPSRHRICSRFRPLKPPGISIRGHAGVYGW